MMIESKTLQIAMRAEMSPKRENIDGEFILSGSIVYGMAGVSTDKCLPAFLLASC
jgi:hypothetical protein